MIVVILDQETLLPFIHPGLDLQTGQLIELYPVEPVPIQLELSFEPEGEPCAVS